MSILPSAEGSLNLLTYRIGNIIIGNYPQLLRAVMFEVMVLLIPQSWILRPLLSLFGFGLRGPVRGAVKPRNCTFRVQFDIAGSAAAWLQRYFFGAAVGAGSWFSSLQAAGMGVFPTWAWLVTKVPLLIGSVIVTMFPFLNRR
ncbi:hypothetical protein HD554DRAFT_2099564 [Boletus coccyginus]|nr:hypothetical protein HD554DRAFT_2099564 [Boletus coccyginus]